MSSLKNRVKEVSLKQLILGGIALFVSGGAVGVAIEQMYMQKTGEQYRQQVLRDSRGTMIYDYHNLRTKKHSAFIRQKDGLYDRAGLITDEGEQIILRSETGVDYGIDGENIEIVKRRPIDTRPSVDTKRN